jgi:uncharacterized membrane protein YozB (DUF420 family)
MSSLPKHSKLQFGIGFILGLIMPPLGFWLVLQLRPELSGIQKFDHEIVKQLNLELISLGMLLNAAIFFVALQFEAEKLGRGILLASVLVLLILFIYMFLL